MNTKEAIAEYGEWATAAGVAAIVRINEKPGLSPSQSYKEATKHEGDDSWGNLSFRDETVLAIANRAKMRQP